MGLKETNYLPDVKAQYEDLPYPPRNPEDEKDRLLSTQTEYLGMINHMCFQGKRDFSKGFRCLVAGGGTGDATIFLAEQLKDYAGVEVIHVDLSTASIAICKERAKIRELTNIKWIEGSLLDLPDMDIGEFDYINCSGVLHHLESPVDGLNALKSVLKEDGAMSIMVYGKYGRLPIYPTQDALRHLNVNAADMQEKLENTKAFLGEIPKNHFANMNPLIDHEYKRCGDSGLYDLLLHSQDRAYTVLDVYEWVEGCGLNVISFDDPFDGARGYKPERYIKKSQALLDKVKALPLRDQQYIAEYMHGLQIKHVFYASKKTKEQCIAPVGDRSAIPFFAGKDPEVHLAISNAIPEKLPNVDEAPMGMRGRKVVLPINHITKEIIKLIDGGNSVAEILDKAEEALKKRKMKVSRGEIENTFDIIFHRFHEADNMWFKFE